MSIQVYAGMATFRPRLRSIRPVIESLLPQVDHLCLYGNRLRREDIRLVHEKFRFLPMGVDRGDAGKFWPMFTESVPQDALFLSVDDDIIYPDDYVSRIIEIMTEVKKTGRKAAISFHGRRFSGFPIRSFYKEGTPFHCLRDVFFPEMCHTIGTGVMAFWANDIRMAADDFSNGYMADIHFAKVAKAQGVELWVMPHREGWLTLANQHEKHTIYNKFRNSDRIQTQAINQIYEQ